MCGDFPPPYCGFIPRSRLDYSKEKVNFRAPLAIYGECELILRRNKRDGTIISGKRGLNVALVIYIEKNV